jgi:FMN-dependent oxidoreductase (nitrilotriacetate monooxygenase family)
MTEATNGKMRLVGVWSPPGAHQGGWRMPNSPSKDDVYGFENMARVAHMCEEGKMDALFLADANYLHTTPMIEKGDHAADSYSKIARPEAISMISALAAVTKHLGVIATASTTYHEPFNLARSLATVELVSGGRGGWNLVTSQIDAEAQNYGFDSHMEHGDRYKRAGEFFDVCAGLWDGWAADALVLDKENARFSDVTKFHVLNHVGEHFKVKGPLNIQRSPQGRPIIAQAGASGPGKDLAARIADIVFLASSTLEDTKAFTDDVRTRAVAAGREADSLKTLPGLMPIIGRTEEEAKEHYLRLQEGITDEEGLIALRRISVGVDLTKFPLDGPLPELPPTNGATTRQQIVLDWARKENLTLREVGRRFAEANGHNLVYGTPESIADMMQEWFEKRACDGFCVLFPYFPDGVQDFVQLVIPELQRRGLFRTEYEGKTLRENLGLAMPKSRFA